MITRHPQLDMTPGGEFRSPPRTPVTNRIIAYAVILAVVAGAVAFAALALWVALALIPIVLVAVLIAVVTVKFKLWQMRRANRGTFAPPARRY